MHRRLAALEQMAWDRRKRQILRDAFTEVALERRWTPGRLEQKVQEALDEFNRMEPALRVMCRQGATLGEVVAWMAAECGLDADALRTEVERDGLAGKDRLRWR